MVLFVFIPFLKIEGIRVETDFVAFIPGLPVYGGLARSKINEYSGSKTLLSGVALAFFTFLAAQYLLEPLAWLPVRSLHIRKY